MRNSDDSFELTFEQSEEKLDGQINHIFYHDEIKGYTVFLLEIKGQMPVKVVGYTPAIKEGEYATVTGSWFIDPRYGREFKASFIRFRPPATLEGIETYLASGLVKGIGPKCAKKLVDAFGEDVFDVIENEPEKLLTVEGIGEKRIELIRGGWAEQTIVRDIMVFLHSNGVSTTKATRIYKAYGHRAIDIVRNNPYRLIQDIAGISFKSADRIAQNIGIDTRSMIRARAGISFTLSEAALAGHCCLQRDDLVKKAVTLLDIPADVINEAIDAELKVGNVIEDHYPVLNSIFPSHFYRAECAVARNLTNLCRGDPPWPDIDPVGAIDLAENSLGFELAESQKEAVTTAIASKVTVITGGPGVGKTTLVKSILSVLQTADISIELCAPTGRAAKRLSETSGYPAQTIHRLLGVDRETMDFVHNEENPLSCDLLIVDECSMMDLSLANSLIKAIPSHAAVIFVGDVDQLPSVGPGSFLSDLINSNAVPVIRLTEIFRQSASSWIVRVAHQINRGEMPTFPRSGENGDCIFIKAEQPETIADTVVELASKRLPDFLDVDPKKDIQVLSPRHQTETGVIALNERLQQLLNPPEGNVIKRYGTSFSVGDKVMQIINNYKREVFNGDVGFVKKIDDTLEEVTVDFNGYEVSYPYSELDELKLCYAMSIHKSQGSEYPIVIIPLSNQHYTMLKRNLIYTAVTRGKKLVVLVGQKRALSLAVAQWRVEKRQTGLIDRLEELSGIY